MTSGSLELGEYFRAESLGEGSYGSVMTVYNEDGEQFALKLFLDEEEVDEEDSEYEPDLSIMLGALREISILRLLRQSNGHPNIVNIEDIQLPSYDEEEEGGEVDASKRAMRLVMPLYADGTLDAAIRKCQIRNKKDKVYVAHGILSAVAYLHDNGIIHRDIKGDNILLTSQPLQNDTNNNNNNTNAETSLHQQSSHPVLIDFSLAKLVNANMYMYNNQYITEPKISSKTNTNLDAGLNQLLEELHASEEGTHTPSMGTPTYRAPEIIQGKHYGLPVDLWSVGVILLELLLGKNMDVEKDKDAIAWISLHKQKLPDDTPFAHLIRGLLEEDPNSRWTARQALQSELFTKFGYNSSSQQSSTSTIVNIADALPLEGPLSPDQFKFANFSNQLKKRYRMIQKFCKTMDTKHPLTPQAAFTYSVQLSELDPDIDDLNVSQGLLDCVILACKFFEKYLPSLNELDNDDTKPFQNWSKDSYIDTESTLWMLLDFCLLPRVIVQEK